MTLLRGCNRKDPLEYYVLGLCYTKHRLLVMLNHQVNSNVYVCSLTIGHECTSNAFSIWFTVSDRALHWMMTVLMEIIQHVSKLAEINRRGLHK